MADIKLATALVGTNGPRATIDALLHTRTILERAEGTLVRAHEGRMAEKVDGFAVAVAKSGVAPADALKAQRELEALTKDFGDQQTALDFWKTACANRLGRIATDYWPDVAEALDAKIASLRQEEWKEQGDVEEVKSVISTFEALRTTLHGMQKQPTAAAARKPGAKAEHA